MCLFSYESYSQYVDPESDILVQDDRQNKIFTEKFLGMSCKEMLFKSKLHWKHLEQNVVTQYLHFGCSVTS